MKNNNCPLGIKIIIALLTIPLVLAILIVVNSYSLMAISNLILMFLPLPFLGLAYALYKRKNWARILLIVLSLIAMLIFVIEPLMQLFKESYSSFPFVSDLFLAIAFNAFDVNLFNFEGDLWFILLLNIGLFVASFSVASYLSTTTIRIKNIDKKIVEIWEKGPSMRIRRLFAVLTDRLLIALVVIRSFYLSHGEIDRFIMTTGIMLSILFLTQILMIIIKSQTLGKYIFKIKVINAKTNKKVHPLRYIFMRFLMGEMLFGLAILIFPYFIVDSLFIFRKDKRTLHDLIAGTRVVEV
jgi:uncharacterized RDD family membrane protein YckC